MKAEIINIGSEFLKGRVPQSGAIIADYMSCIGMDIQRITTVSDDMSVIASAVAAALNKSDIVAVSGGMGASSDDVTVAGIKKAVKIRTVFSRQAMENVASYFAKKGMEVPRHCDGQAEVFEGAEILLNPKGSCVGQFIEISKDKFIILLPGRREEVESIFKRSLLKILKDKYETGIRKTSVLRFAGICEGEIPKSLKKVIETEKHLEKGELEFYFESTGPGCDINITAYGSNEMLVDELLHKTAAEIYAAAGDCIYGCAEETLQEAAGKLLGKNRKTISVAESCTGGLLSSKLTDVPGSSLYFERGVVAYSPSSKKQILNVKSETIKKHSAVSAEVASEMAENIKKESGTDYSISITGYAGPSSERGKKPGYAFAALSGPSGTEVFELSFTGPRMEVKEKFTYACLEKLWRKLKK